jgi:DNA-binding transcriptional LysR family regulator
MEAASFDLLRAGNSVTNTLWGEVRVAITEALGTFWLAPRLVDFQQSFPNILVDLHYAMRSADVSRHEADVRSICRGPPRLMSNWSGSAEYI